MSTVLNWSRFQTGKVSPGKAFEAFTAQLFERWLRREYGTSFRSYVLHGEGGDGGVEAFATLPSGEVIGLQAKWFDGNLDASRISQIQKSLDGAVQNHPTLKRFIVALRQNLTSARNKREKGGVAHWEEFIKKAKTSCPSVEIIRWDEAELNNQLAAPTNQEIKALWFEGELIFSSIQKPWEKTKSHLRERYLPDLHTVDLMDAQVDQDLWLTESVNTANKKIIQCKDALKQANLDLQRFVWHVQGTDGLEVAAKATKEVFDSLIAHADALLAVLQTGPGTPLAEFPITNPVYEFKELIDEHKERNRHSYTADYAESALRNFPSTNETLEQLDQALRKSARPRIIMGPPGCGKTHAAADLVRRQVEADIPAVMILARDHDPAMGIRHILAEILDTPNWPLGRMLDALEALTTLHQIKASRQSPPPAGFSRCLLLIDGLEESIHAVRWIDVLSDLHTALQTRPRLHLIATTRPEFAPQLNVSKTLVCWYLPEETHNLPEMLDKYKQKYEFSIQTVPWLGWALRTPLEVRLLAEEFKGREITAFEGATANLLTLFRRKLTRLEEEARTRAGSEAWSSNLDLVRKTLQSLAMLIANDQTRWVEDKPIIQQVSQEDPEFTARSIRSVLERLQEHGLVDRYTPPVRGLERPPHQYTLATRHLADLMLAYSLAEKICADIEHRRVLSYPPALTDRDAAATLFAAQLAEKNHFIVDLKWENPPADLCTLHVSSLVLLAPDQAGRRRAEIAARLTTSTANNRVILRSLVVPVSRIPGHPLGVRILDEALRRLPLAQRDPIWSVPDNLTGNGPWRGNSDLILDEFELSSVADRWDGLPLLAAWTTSSVVEERRRRAREMLAIWGTARLAEMVKLMEHMADVDDPQVLDDCVVAAFGAAIGAPMGDPALRDLALLMDRLFFAKNAHAWTESVPVRVAARGIIERAALVFPGEFDDLLTRARPPYAPRGGWPGIDEEEVNNFDHGLVWGHLSWHIAERCFRDFATGSSKYFSAKYKNLLSHAAKVTGVKNPAPNAVRNGMIAHLVKSWGWSKEVFSPYQGEGSPVGVDNEITQRYRRETRDLRSKVACFEEKYVWAAVDRIAGALADRLPVWSDIKETWYRLRSLDKVGNGVPDPLPRSPDGDEGDQAEAWAPANILCERFNEEEDLAVRAEKWLTDAQLPDPCTFVRGAVAGWKDAALLGLRHYRLGHLGCIDQEVQVRAMGVQATDIERLKRVAPSTLQEPDQYHTWVEGSVYKSPTVACWAPWLTWSGEDHQINDSSDSNSYKVKLRALLGQFTASFEGEWPQEPTAWGPAPSLARGLGVVGLRGGRWRREYVDRQGAPYAIERDVLPPIYDFDHHYLAMDMAALFKELKKKKQVPVWIVQLWRRATPALYMKGDKQEPKSGLVHRRRNVIWLVIGSPKYSSMEVFRIKNELESWESYNTPKE